VDFAEISEFIDTPVKRYSSGMYVRLAFAVAAHLETEIMLVDEVLAVGDVAFQKKCLGKMKDVAGVGRTVLFVSHNMVAIRTLCSRALLIDQGRLVLDADTDSVVARYLDRNLIEGSVASESEIADRVEGDIKRESPNFRITEVRIENLQGVTKTVFDSTESVVVSVSFTCFRTVRDLRVLAAVADENGYPIYGSQNTDDSDNAKMFYSVSPGEYTAKCALPTNTFGNRKFYLNVDMLSPKTEHHVLIKILEFQVDFSGYNPDIQYASNTWGWAIWPKLTWTCKNSS
ncbi:MAG: Wzt carbohydrate-binding domain-containing protein, partial [Pseudomonadota bacterium]